MVFQHGKNGIRRFLCFRRAAAAAHTVAISARQVQAGLPQRPARTGTGVFPHRTAFGSLSRVYFGREALELQSVGGGGLGRVLPSFCTG